MRKQDELYASFYINGYWCGREVKKFNNNPSVDDQSSHIEIGTSNTPKLKEKYN